MIISSTSRPACRTRPCPPGELSELRVVDWTAVAADEFGVRRVVAPGVDRLELGAEIDRTGALAAWEAALTAASLLLAQGVSARVVMETLGHSSYALTMDTYTHVMPTLMRDAADAMDRALRAGK